MIGFQFPFNWDLEFTKEEQEDIDKILKNYIDDDGNHRKDFCYDCGTDKLYCHAMTFKCKICDKIILGGDNA